MSINFNRNDNISVPIPILILLVEITMGGIGRLFHLPVRYIVFGIISLLAVRYFYIYNIKIDKDAKKFGIGILIYVAFGILIGILNGNSILTTIGDVTNFFAIAYTYILIVFIDYKDEILYKLIDLFINITLIISIVTIIIFIASYIGQLFDLNSVLIIDTIEYKLNYGIISGWLYDNQFARVYLPNGIYMQVALAILIQKFVINTNPQENKITALKIVTIILAILASGTRGYWLGAGIVVFITIFTLNKKERISYLKIVSIMVSVGMILVLILPIRNEILSRISSIFNFSEDLSNSIRKVQFNHMINQFKQNPIFGSGFGTELIGYVKETGRSGLDFELYYVELLYKTGILGIFIFIYTLGKYIILKPFKLLFDNIDDKDRIILSGWLVGTVSVMAISITNPYISGNYGLFILDMMVVIFVVLKNKYRR